LTNVFGATCTLSYLACFVVEIQNLDNKSLFCATLYVHNRFSVWLTDQHPGKRYISHDCSVPDVDGTLLRLWSEVDVLGQHRDDGWNLLLGIHVRL